MRLDGLPLAYRSPYLFRLPTFGEMRARLEERLAERTRIAQDLHDTVLQGIFSAAMQLHVAVDELPANSPAKLRLSRVLELMRHLMEEGRNVVRGLRFSNSDSDDLGQAFFRIPQDLGIEVQIDFRVIVLGSTRKLHPLIRDEVYRIGRELLVNAFRHSRASWIELELEYAPKRFRMVVRDDGCGIDPQVLHEGREGHWGLLGMREQAKRIGARLRVWSRAAAGTEVELSVPNSIAFNPE
ncbi:MAG TPA: histidine kinase [Terriglobales bacterium]|nr:histidine kinase [Terriglobales bacterium]